MMMLFLDLSPIGGGIGVFAAVAFFLVLGAAAFIAFKLLKKSVKMAFRMVIVAVILAVAIAGSLALWLVGSSKPTTRPQPRPAQTR